MALDLEVKGITRSGNGTLTSPPSRCYLFDGDDDRITFLNALALTGDFTVSWWWNFNAFDAGAYHFVLGHNEATHNIGILGGATHNMRIIIGSTPTTLTLDEGDFSTDTWYHMILIRSGTTLTLYRDLVLDETQTVSTNTWRPELLGHGFDGVAEYLAFDGKIFDVRVYAVAITVGADRTIINEFGDPGVPLVRWFKGDDTDALVATDSGPVGDHGTKSSITLPGFHYAGTDVPFNYNEIIPPSGGARWKNTGAEFLVVDNILALGGTIDVITNGTRDTLAIDDIQFTGVQGRFYLMGPFATEVYNDSSGYINIDWTYVDETNLNISVFTLSQAGTAGITPGS